MSNVRWSEELLEQHVHPPRHLGHEEVLSQPVQRGVLVPVPLDLAARTEVGGGRALGRRIAPCLLLALNNGEDSAAGCCGRGASSPGELLAGEDCGCHGDRKGQRRVQLMQMGCNGRRGEGQWLGVEVVEGGEISLT